MQNAPLQQDPRGDDFDPVHMLPRLAHVPFGASGDGETGEGLGIGFEGPGTGLISSARVYTGQPAGKSVQVHKSSLDVTLLNREGHAPEENELN